MRSTWLKIDMFFFSLIDVFLGYKEVGISFKPSSTNTGKPFVYIKKKVFLCVLLGNSPASEFIRRRFETLCLFHFHRQVGVEWVSLRNYPEENIKHSEEGESLKSRKKRK
jgi:hypothetical protein